MLKLFTRFALLCVILEEVHGVATRDIRAMSAASQAMDFWAWADDDQVEYEHSYSKQQFRRAQLVLTENHRRLYMEDELEADGFVNVNVNLLNTRSTLDSWSTEYGEQIGFNQDDTAFTSSSSADATNPDLSVLSNKASEREVSKTHISPLSFIVLL